MQNERGLRSSAMITFPPGELTAAPTRLSILAQTQDWLALDKPAGVGLVEEKIEPGVPVLERALQKAVASGKRQLRELGMHAVFGVQRLDAEITGVAMFALSSSGADELRGALASGGSEYVFDVLTAGAARPPIEPVRCELPLVRDLESGRMRVSHAQGKKCCTVFSPQRCHGRYVLWEARTRENRPHQVRVHAVESGLHIPGERTYDSVSHVFLSMIKRGYRPGRDREQPLHAPLCVHLREIHLSNGAGATRIVAAPRPRSFIAMLRRIAEAFPPIGQPSSNEQPTAP